MLQISGLNVRYDEEQLDSIKKKISKKFRVNSDEIISLKIKKRSIDARKKPEIYFSYVVIVELKNEKRFQTIIKKDRNIIEYKPKARFADTIKKIETNKKVVVVGAGPAGLFAAYYLSLSGVKVTLIDRGKKVEDRVKDVERFWQEGLLKKDSNVCFGEGGAGTFSDGKLNTGVKDKDGRKEFVLESFVEFGAKEDILYDSKPHIGTDVLRTVISNMRHRLIENGVEIRFQTKLSGFDFSNDKLVSINTICNEKQDVIECDKVILAIGHSARDTFYMLKDEGFDMEQKAFALGVRVQHPQKDIDFSQYGVNTDKLPPSPYKCVGKTKNERGVYSFCMCPGGYVVNASTEQGMLVVNGMSDANRDSGYANSAIVVSVNSKDFGSSDSLAGIEYQRRIEKKLYELADGSIPVQTYADFKKDTQGCIDESNQPCVKGKWKIANIRAYLPEYISDGIIDGIEYFGTKIKGFDKDSTLILGVETRTSSPVRINRNDTLKSISHNDIYPCGEGAGYAGGIMSAAMDGLKVARQIWKEIYDE